MSDDGKENFAKRLFENERIKVWDFRLPSGEALSAISHPYYTIRWQVDEGQHQLIEQSSPGGKTKTTRGKEENVPDRSVFDVAKGTTWDLKNIGPGEYRQIVFEILSDTPKYSQAQVDELLQQAKYSTSVGTKLLLENDLCRVWDFYLAPGEGGGPETVHQHCLDYVFVNVAPSHLLGLHPEKLSLNENELVFDSVSQDDDVTWNYIPEKAVEDPITYSHGGKNGFDDRPMREYLVELK